MQNAVTAALHGQVQMLADFGLGGNGVDQLMAGILGMAGHKADLIIARHSAQHIQQVGKIHRHFQPLAVAVYILA